MKTQETKPMHTPTPWYRDGDLITKDSIQGEMIADAESEVDAKFIVTAVNSHEELVSALDKAIELLFKVVSSEIDRPPLVDLRELENTLKKAKSL